jgi:hypothetical protein
VLILSELQARFSHLAAIALEVFIIKELLDPRSRKGQAAVEQEQTVTGKFLSRDVSSVSKEYTTRRIIRSQQRFSGEERAGEIGATRPRK